MRLIDADALVQMLENDAKHMKDPVGRAWTYAAINDIKNAPTADVPERKVGKWITGTYNSVGDILTMTVKCSCCGKESVSLFSTDSLLWNIEMIYDFCPNCGADMRKETDDATD